MRTRASSNERSAESDIVAPTLRAFASDAPVARGDSTCVCYERRDRKKAVTWYVDGGLDWVR